jgi:aminoglycoside phosphotransferase
MMFLTLFIVEIRVLLNQLVAHQETQISARAVHGRECSPNTALDDGRRAGG